MMIHYMDILCYYMIKRKYFNVTLSRDMIAQAYQDNESYDSLCFLLGPLNGSHLPLNFKINDAYLVDGNLNIDYTNNTEYDVDFYIENGNLKVKFIEDGHVSSIVDLGNVVGPQGPRGDAGISPTFVLGDGTGGTINGHLYADYDNPYIPD